MTEIAQIEFELIKKDLIDLYDAKSMRASGAFADSLEVIQANYKTQLWGLDYVNQLQSGQAKGTFPSIEAISKWIVDKGVFSSALQTIKLSTLAFLIARKINNFGWKREQFGGVELVSKVITPQRIDDIINKVGVAEAIKITSQIKVFYDTTFRK